MLEDYVLFLAEIDNENEASGRKQQIEWEEEMKDAEKFKEWQKKYSKIANKTIDNVQVKPANKKITFKKAE